MRGLAGRRAPVPARRGKRRTAGRRFEAWAEQPNKTVSAQWGAARDGCQSPLAAPLAARLGACCKCRGFDKMRLG
jgi:hypothetical protein